MNPVQFRFLQLALEARSEEAQQVEKEIIVIGEIIDFTQLKKASRSEKQEQWGVSIDCKETGYKGQVRIRCVDGQEYYLTSKTHNGERSKQIETEVKLDKVVGQAMMEEFKKFSSTGMIKTRYFFPVKNSDLVWEVDVFFDEDGKPKSWCKIDLEVNDLRSKMPDLPIDLKNDRTLYPTERSDELQAFADRIRKQHFCTPSPYTKK